MCTGQKTAPQKDFDVNKVNWRGETQLFIASKNGNQREVKRLLETEGIQVNIPNEHGESPLFKACEEAGSGKKNNFQGVIQLLISAHGIDVNSVEQNGASPLLIAAQYGNLDIVNLLLTSSSIKINGIGKQTKIINDMTIDAESLWKVKVMIWPMHRTPTILYVAAQNGNVNIVNALLAKEGILVNELSSGETPLLVATLYSSRTEGHREVVRSLLKVKGINTNLGSMRGSDGNITRMTPLFLASQNNDLEIVNLLLKVKGIDVNLMAPLLMAANRGHINVVRSLLQHTKIDVNHLHAELGCTTLYLACQEGRLDIVNLLLDIDGIDINLGNKGVVYMKNGVHVKDGVYWNKVPFWTANDNDHMDIVSRLLEEDTLDTSVWNDEQEGYKKKHMERKRKKKKKKKKKKRKKKKKKNKGRKIEL